MDTVIWGKNIWQGPWPQGGYNKHSKYLTQHKAAYNKLNKKGTIEETAMQLEIQERSQIWITSPKPKLLSSLFLYLLQYPTPEIIPSFTS